MTAHPSPDESKIGELLATFQNAQNSPIENFRRAIQTEQKPQQNQFRSILNETQKIQQNQARSALQTMQNSHQNQIKSALQTVRKSPQNQFRSILKAIQGPEHRANTSPKYTVALRVLNQHPDFASIVPEITDSSVLTRSTATSTETPSYPSAEFPQESTEPPWLSVRTTAVLFRISLFLLQNANNQTLNANGSEYQTINILDNKQTRARISMGVAFLYAAENGMTEIVSVLNLAVFLYGAPRFLANLLGLNE